MSLTLEEACRAVGQALRPRDRATITRVAGAVAPDAWLELMIVGEFHIERSVPWYDAYGHDLTMALTVVCDVDEADASHLIGAALQAHLSAGLDLVPDSVLRLAERGACYQKAVDDCVRHMA